MFDFHTHIPKNNAVVNLPFRSVEAEEGLTFSAGIHPWNSEEFTDNDWLLIEQLAIRPNVLMIGECGIDKLRGASIEKQTEIFIRHVELSEKIGKPLVIHCVRSAQEICSLHCRLKPVQKWVIHGFRGNERVAEMLLKEGLYISFGEKFQEKALMSVPVDRMFVETDDTTTPVDEIYGKIAKILSMGAEELEKACVANFKAVSGTK